MFRTLAAGPSTSLPPFPGIHVCDDPVAVEESGVKPRIEALPCQQSLDDSETEDESDDEVPDSILAKGDGEAPSVDDSSRQSQIPHWSVGDENSLPNVLTDFLDMFGEGDGSYPDDFPYSLR